MLIRRREQEIRRTQPRVFAASATISSLDRRTFLRRSGLAAGTHAMMSMVRLDSVRAAEASGSKAGAAVEVRKNVCTHCSVGCTVIAEVENGVWTRQQPAWDSPINRGTHCAKGAAIREVVHGGRRLKYPLKLEGGEWKRISWDQAAPAQGTTWPPAGPPLADVPQQKSGMAAPVPPPESAQKPPFVTRLLERE